LIAKNGEKKMENRNSEISCWKRRRGLRTGKVALSISSRGSPPITEQSSDSRAIHPTPLNFSQEIINRKNVRKKNVYEQTDFAANYGRPMVDKSSAVGFFLPLAC
jgi:hypothetical protein